jgi:hypothetical protein
VRWRTGTAQASTFSDGWPQTAVVLRTLASMYDTDAREEETRTERFRQGAEVRCSGRRDRPPRGTAKQMLMAVAQSAMHNWLDHPFAVSRPRPSPAGVPPHAAGRGAAQSTRSTWRVYQR